MSVTRHSVSITAIRDITVEKRLQDENRILKDTMKASYKFGDMIGRSPAMQSVYELITKAASSDFHTVIYGESGTGKEVAARTIWQLGRRRNGPFVAVNCGAVSETLFEREFFGHRKGSFTHADRDQPGFFDAAHRGTLFLDELGELMPAMQVKLLRVLESGEYIPVGDTKAKKADVRIISATNRNLPDLVARGKFREDLFYRIHVIEIIIPPLRERKEDIPLLADHFLSRVPDSGERPRVPGKILDALCRYEWPGNVRELENTLQRFVATNQLTLSGTRIMSADTEDLNPEQGLKHAIETVERRMIRETLQKTGWHRGKASKLLKIPRRTLHRKMAKYGFEK
jgi:transcriptional regulator with PAS, ATPase and Fis domain